MRSLRTLVACAGIDSSARVSVLFDYFGFARGTVPEDPDTSVTAQVSVLGRAARIDSHHFHLNVIRVGFDTLSATDLADGLLKLDYAVYRAHRIFAAQGLGVGRVQHYEISSTDSNGRDDLGSETEADDLSDEWSVDNDGIDAFVVRTISDPDYVGISPVEGDCDKGSSDDGLVAGEIGRGIEGFARTFSHEIGHFLGLSHNHGSNCPSTDAAQRNLMAQTRCVPMIPSTNTRDVRNAVRLTSSDGSNIRDHCSVREGC
jgi:hypothetical protein